MSHFNIAPPPYDEVIEEEPGAAKILCRQCGHPSTGLLYCLSCGAAVTQPGSIPPPAYAPPAPIHVQPTAPHAVVSTTPLPKVQVVQPAVSTQNQSMFQARPQPSQPPPAVNSLNDMSIRNGDRLIYDFEKIGCCIGEVHGLEAQVKDNIHPEVQQKGVTPQQWREWMSELEEIQKMATTVTGCLCIFCFPGGIIQSILCAMLCPVSMNHPFTWLPCCYGDWYEGLRKWMRKVNTTLGSKGMYAKLVTYKPFGGAPRSKFYDRRITGKDHNYEMSFLMIALTPAESTRLEQESWDHGVNDGCTSGIGRCL